MLKYITAALLVLAITFGYSTYSLTEKVGGLKSDNLALVEKANKAVAGEELAKKSCVITGEVTSEVQSKNTTLTNELTATLEALAKLPSPTPQVKKDDATGASTESPKAYADDGRISPDLKRLLDDAYCSGDKDSSACTAK